MRLLPHALLGATLIGMCGMDLHAADSTYPLANPSTDDALFIGAAPGAVTSAQVKIGGGQIVAGGAISVGTAPIANHGLLQVNYWSGAVDFDVTSTLARGNDTNFNLVTTNGVHTTNGTNDIVSRIGLRYAAPATDNAFIRFHRGGGTTGGCMSFSVNNDIEALRIDSLGNVGIGTGSPGAFGSGGNPTILQVHGTAGTIPYGLLELSTSLAKNGNPTGQIDFGCPSRGRTAVINSTCTNDTSLTGNLIFYTASNGGSVTEHMKVNDAGVTIRTTNQGTDGLVVAHPAGAFVSLRPNTATANSNPLVQAGDAALIFGQGTADTGALVIGQYATSAKGIRITAAGNVGIGIINPTSALAVNGTISAKEIKVVANPADYVFADGYRLRPLAEVEAYIAAHKHLPGVASAKEQEEQGVLVTDLMRAHLEKIEELTLYAIQMKDENAKLREQNAVLEKRMRAIERALGLAGQ